QGGVDPASREGSTMLTQWFSKQAGIPISFHNLGIYGQDEWRAKPQLALTFALRAEHYSNPVCQTRCFARLRGPYDSVSHNPNQPYDQAIVTNQKQAFLATDKILWSPRFSFAWQPLGVSHHTVLRGGI